MANDKTGIEWTDATWNPTVGCSLVSPGCTNCYAMKQAHRIQTMADAAASKKAGGLKLNTSDYAGTTKVVKNTPVWTGMVKMLPKRLTQPLRWTKPRTVFVNSMSDLFHESLSDDEIDQVFAVMAFCPQHTFQILTKRPARMRAYLAKQDDRGRHSAMTMAALMAATGQYSTPALDLKAWPLPNVHVGTSVEDQTRFDERALELAKCCAVVRFLSCEPLLGPVTMSGMLGNFDWVIVGGESGPGRRPFDPDWARKLRDECAMYNTPFFMKQVDKVIPIPEDLMIKEMPHQDRADLHLIGQPR